MPLAGIGLKDEHAPLLLAGAAIVDFLEVHAENVMGAGGPRLRQLERLRERLPLSIHGVGLSLGGVDPIDDAHLERLAALQRRFEPAWFSEHVAWSVHAGHWYGDLLPVPYDRPTLARVCDNVDRVQSRLGRRLLLENPSTYLGFCSATMHEGEFLTEVVRRTGCGLLLDVNNAYVSGVNHGRDPWSTIGALPRDAIGEIHLAGFSEDRDPDGGRMLIDHHGSPVDEAVWQLYERVIEWVGPVPTLIERDNHIPPLSVLVGEADRARQVQCATGAAGTGMTAPVRTIDDGVGDGRGQATFSAAFSAAFVTALLDPQRPVPAGLTSGHGSDLAHRFGIHRNNVVAGLVAALSELFPVLCQLVGEPFFRAMFAAYARAHPPTSPMLSVYGESFADWLSRFAPAASLPYLPDMARLERARVLAWHAADAAPVAAGDLAAALAEPAALPGTRIALHPSLQVLRSDFDIVSLWSAHRPGGDVCAVELERTCAALVLRNPDDDVEVLDVPLPTAAFCEALLHGRPLARAVAEAPGVALAPALALLLSRGVIRGWQAAPPGMECAR